MESAEVPISHALKPLDDANRQLQAAVHPVDWKNPVPDGPYDLVVIGAGTAGLVTAAGAAGLGARVALIERELMGGDCLNVGCVPSKALLAAARRAAAVRDAEGFGIKIAGQMEVDFAAVMHRMRKLRAQISPNDSAERFRNLGVDVYLGAARFGGGDQIQLENCDGASELRYRKAVIATGARAAVPPIDGMEASGFLTNETLFSLEELPKRMAVIGAGPIGCEMAQAFARFGSEVLLFQSAGQILPREDREAAQIVQAQMELDGVQLRLDTQVDSVGIAGSNGKQGLTMKDQLTVGNGQSANGVGSRLVVRGQHCGTNFSEAVDHLLVATGRAPNVESLGLETVGVEYSRRGIQVDDFLRTTNPRIFAAGDVCSAYQFTHAADFQARIVIQNALFAIGPFGRRRASQLRIPWATYTAPEIAHVGWYPRDAERQGVATDTYTQPLAENDRAILEGPAGSAPAGFVKVHTLAGKDQIVGATIVGDHAGELISELTVAMNGRIGLSKIGASIHPYPTQADAIRRLGDQYNRTRLTAFSRRLLGWLKYWNVGS